MMHEHMTRTEMVWQNFALIKIWKLDLHMKINYLIIFSLFALLDKWISKKIFEFYRATNEGIDIWLSRYYVIENLHLCFLNKGVSNIEHYSELELRWSCYWWFVKNVWCYLLLISCEKNLSIRWENLSQMWEIMENIHWCIGV